MLTVDHKINIKKGEQFLAKADLNKIHKLITIKFEKKSRAGLSQHDKAILEYMDDVASKASNVDSFGHSGSSADTV